MKNKLFWIPVWGLLLTLLLVGGGFAIYRGAWGIGFTAGQAAQVDTTAALPPYAMYAAGMPHFGGLFTLLLGILLALMALGILSRWVGFLMFRSAFSSGKLAECGPGMHPHMWGRGRWHHFRRHPMAHCCQDYWHEMPEEHAKEEKPSEEKSSNA